MSFKKKPLRFFGVSSQRQSELEDIIKKSIFKVFHIYLLISAHFMTNKDDEQLSLLTIQHIQSTA